MVSIKTTITNIFYGDYGKYSILMGKCIGGITPDEIIAYRYGGNFDEFGGVAPKAVYSGDGVEEKQIARGLEQRLYEGDLKATGGDTKKVANRQNPVGVKNPNRDKYLAAADEHLKTKGIH